MSTSNISGIVLHKILSDPLNSLSYWGKLKLAYFQGSFSSIYTAVNKYYIKHSNLPSFNDLEIISRDAISKANIAALQKLEIPEDVDTDIAIEALLNDYIQRETLSKLTEFVDDVQMLDSAEIKDNLGNIVYYLEEKTHTSEEIVNLADFSLYDEEDMASRIFLGLNNSFDAATGGVSVTELLMLGGYRGSGKSVVSANIIVNQYRDGNIGLLFSIEMRAREVNERIMSMLSGVPHSKIRKKELTPADLLKYGKAKADMFVNGQEFYDEYLKHGNYAAFEADLSAKGTIKPDNQIIIIDNPDLSLVDIDMTYQKYKSRFKDKFKVAVVDYVNQIAIDDKHDWKSQIALSTGLKSLSRKHEILTVAPYQIDKSGEARFAKGLLDAADMALTLEAGDDYIKFESTKVRNVPKQIFASKMDWDTLTVSAEDAILEEKAEEEPKKSTSKPKDDELPF